MVFIIVAIIFYDNARLFKSKVLLTQDQFQQVKPPFESKKYDQNEAQLLNC